MVGTIQKGSEQPRALGAYFELHQKKIDFGPIFGSLNLAGQNEFVVNTKSFRKLLQIKRYDKVANRKYSPNLLKRSNPKSFDDWEWGSHVLNTFCHSSHEDHACHAQ